MPPAGCGRIIKARFYTVMLPRRLSNRAKIVFNEDNQ